MLASLLLLVLRMVAGAEAGTPVEIRAAGLGETRSAQVLVQAGQDVLVSDCNDAGVGSDRSPDGIWTCASLEISPDKVEVGLLRDGVLLPAGTLQWPVGPRFIAVRAEAGGAVASTEASALPPALPTARPGGPGAAVLVRLSASPAGPTPMLTLVGPSGNTQLSCRNDGRFPDTTHNDGVFGCSGVAPGASVTVSWRGPDGAGKSFGTITWDPAASIRFLTLDGLGNKPPSTQPFLLQIAAPSSLAPTGPSSPGNPPARPPVETPEAAPYRVLALASAAGLGGVCGFLLRRPRRRLPGGLRPLPSPPILPGGPSSFPAVLHTTDPQALGHHLLPALASRGRVVVVSASSDELRWEQGGPVYQAERRDRLDLALAISLLSREGPAPTVLVIGRSVTDPGAAVGDALRKLCDSLPVGVSVVVVLGQDEEPLSGMPRWDVSGPPWVATRRG